MRLISLLPAATEMIYLLELEKYLVGVSDDCDFPAQVKKLPKLTNCWTKDEPSSSKIDSKVKLLSHQGLSVSHLDEAQLKQLKPTHILTQELCQVCAVPFTQVKQAVRLMDGEVQVISLEPECIEDILANILEVGKLLGVEERAAKEISRLSQRIRNLPTLSSLASGGKFEIGNSKTRPRVLVIEWLDPLMVAAHWIPEMIEIAGGENLISKKGQKSYPITINQIVKANPDTIIFSPCGFSIKRTLQEKNLLQKLIGNLKLEIINLKFYLMDANAYLTRPGPRVINGIEILAEILHPEVFTRKHPMEDWKEFLI